MYVKAPGRNIILDMNATGEVYDDGRALRGIYGREECNNIDEYFDIIYSGRYEEDRYWLSYLRNKGNPSILIDKYFERFNYTLNFEFENTSTTIFYVSSWFTNGEYYFFADNYKEIINSKGIKLIYVYLKGCSACNSFKTIINDVNLYNDLDIYQIEFKQLSSINNLKSTDIKYAPSLIVLEDGNVLDYLESSSDEDKEYYKEAISLSKWLSNYMDINIVATNNLNNEDCSDITCQIQ